MRKTSILIKFLVIFTLLFSSIIKADNSMFNNCENHQKETKHSQINHDMEMKHSMNNDSHDCCDENNASFHDCDICDNCNNFINNIQILNNTNITLNDNKISQFYYYSYKVKEPPFFKERIPPIFLS
tara:strand:- start:1474 stop:1854 length:381 start_codon:yes stop_codon:yes gene_type:complete